MKKHPATPPRGRSTGLAPPSSTKTYRPLRPIHGMVHRCSYGNGQWQNSKIFKSMSIGPGNCGQEWQSLGTASENPVSLYFSREHRSLCSSQRWRFIRKNGMISKGSYTCGHQRGPYMTVFFTPCLGFFWKRNRELNSNLSYLKSVLG